LREAVVHRIAVGSKAPLSRALEPAPQRRTAADWPGRRSSTKASGPERGRACFAWRLIAPERPRRRSLKP